MKKIAIADETKKSVHSIASTIGSACAATAIIVALFSSTAAEAVAICGVCVDYGTKMVIRAL